MAHAALEIGHLKLRLPAELKHRAGAIGKILSEQLAQLQATETKHIETLQLKQIQIQLTQSNAQIAKKIAHSVKAAIDKH